MKKWTQKISFVEFVFILILTPFHQTLAESTVKMERVWLEAAGSGDIEKMRELHKAGVDVETKDILGNRALHYTAKHGQTKALRFLVTELKAEIEAPNTIENRAVHLAARYGQIETLIALVTELGANPEVQNTDGNTPVLLTAMHGQIETLIVLVNELNANVEAQNTEGNRAIHLATMHEQIETLIVLVTELGANIRAKNKYRKTIKSIAEARGHSEILDFLNSQSKTQGLRGMFKCWS